MDVDLSLDYGLTLLAALLIGLGFVLQQNAAQAEPASRFLSLRLIIDLLRTPRWLAGIASMVAGQILAAWSIGNLSLAFVEPLLTTNLVFALILAVPIAKARLRFWEIFGAAVLCTGVALLSASRSAKPIGLSFGSVSHWPAAAVIAGIAFLAVQGGRRHPGRTRAMLTGTAAGLVFGIQDALTRQTLEILQSAGAAAMFTTWAPYALVGAGATGIWLMQSAFSAGPLPQSLPAISAGEPLVGMLLGVLVFGDRIQITSGELALQAAGVAALIAGVIIVGRAPALSQLRAWTPPSLPRVPHVPHVPHVPRSLAAVPGRHAKHPARPHKPAKPAKPAKPHKPAAPASPHADQTTHSNGNTPAPATAPTPAAPATAPTPAAPATAPIPSAPATAPTPAAASTAVTSAATSPAIVPNPGTAIRLDPGRTIHPGDTGYPSGNAFSTEDPYPGGTVLPGDTGHPSGAIHPGDTVYPSGPTVAGSAGHSGGNGFSADSTSQAEPSPSIEPADPYRPDTIALPTRITAVPPAWQEG